MNEQHQLKEQNLVLTVRLLQVHHRLEKLQDKFPEDVPDIQAIKQELTVIGKALTSIHPDLNLQNMDAFIQQIDLTDPDLDLTKPFKPTS